MLNRSQAWLCVSIQNVGFAANVHSIELQIGWSSSFSGRSSSWGCRSFSSWCCFRCCWSCFWSCLRSSFGGAVAVSGGARAIAASAGYFACRSRCTTAALSCTASLQASQQTLRAGWWANFFTNWFANRSWLAYWSWFANRLRCTTAALLSCHLGAKTCQKTWLAATTAWCWFANRCRFAYRSWFACWCTFFNSTATTVMQTSEQAWATATSSCTTAASPTSFHIAAVHRQTSKQHRGDNRHTTPKSSVHLDQTPNVDIKPTPCSTVERRYESGMLPSTTVALTSSSIAQADLPKSITETF